MFFKLFVIAFPLFFAMDMLWIGLIAKKLYFEQIGSLLKPNVNWIAAILFYLLFIAALVVFVIVPAFEKHSLMHAILFGAFFGLVCYATYDLTNLAVAKDWPLFITIVDLFWGAVLASSVATLTYLIANKIGI